MEISRVKVIFLDIGGVLLTNGLGHEARQKAAQTFGLDYAEMDTLHISFSMFMKSTVLL